MGKKKGHVRPSSKTPSQELDEFVAKEDPLTLFTLQEQLGKGAFSQVFKVRS